MYLVDLARIPLDQITYHPLWIVGNEGVVVGKRYGMCVLGMQYSMYEYTSDDLEDPQVPHRQCALFRRYILCHPVKIALQFQLLGGLVSS